MNKIALLFLTGDLLFQSLPVLPTHGWVGVVIGVGVMLLLVRRLQPGFWILAAFLLAWWQADSILSHTLPKSLEGKDLVIEGRVVGIPDWNGRRYRFDLELKQLLQNGMQLTRDDLPKTVRLSWYHPTSKIHSRDIWRFGVRMKRPHGWHNPGGFDYEGWLYQHGINATGYVRKIPDPVLVAREEATALDRWREGVSVQIQNLLSNHGQVGVVQALLVGERGDVNQQFRERMVKTGTMHLMAISGLHISMVFAWCFFLGRWLWVIFPSLPLIIPAQRVGLLFGITGALAYACMAGLTLPTQRALLMVLVMSVSLLSGYRLLNWGPLSTALLVILVWDPNAVLSTGFWLSFVAVALIFVVLMRESDKGRGHVGGLRKWLNHGWRWGRIQFALLIGLAPILMYSFGLLSGLSPVANLIAIPWVGFLILPLLLLGTLLIPLSDSFASWCLHAGADQIAFLDQYLGYLMRFDSLTWMTIRPSLWQVGLALVGLGFMIISRPLRIKAIGIPLFLIAFFPVTASIPAGAFRATILDVGQGLSILLETRNHVWVYDTGPSYSPRLIAAEQALWPTMQNNGRTDIDHLVISHSDRDHSGGVSWLRDHVQVEEVLSSDVDRYRGQFPVIHYCQAGQQWEEDGVHFEMLHPRADEPLQENNASCVLRVTAGDMTFLIAGDIEREAEKILINRLGQALQADVLIVPHHGSLTSSSPEFLQAVQPRFAIVSSGYRNRFGFPREKVLQRYQQIGAKILNTAEDGAITINAGPEGLNVSAYRTRFPHYWNTER